MREITPVANNGSIQLKFSYGGKRYSFNPIPGGKFTDKRDLATARSIAVKIQNDILAGNFDQTLDRYRLAPTATPAKPQPKALLTIWDLWVSSLDLPEATKANHYEMVRRMLVKANPGLADTGWLTGASLAAATIKDRLNLIRSCCRWAVAKGHLETNPYEALKLRRAAPKKIKPFTDREIKAIVAGFEELAPHYTAFAKFLLIAGVRTAEAIGLRWSHVDLTRETVTIAESLPIDVLGNGYRRIRKGTKTGSVRVLTMNQQLKALLLTLWSPEVNPDELIFKTPNGCVIDAGNFRERQWAKVLAHCDIPYRKPYTTRHTMISHAIEQGIPITGVSYLAGHKDTRMVMQTYGHMVNRPNLPEMPV